MVIARSAGASLQLLSVCNYAKLTLMNESLRLDSYQGWIMCKQGREVRNEFSATFSLFESGSLIDVFRVFGGPKNGKFLNGKLVRSSN